MSTLADGHTLSQEQARQVTSHTAVYGNRQNLYLQQLLCLYHTNKSRVIWHTPNLLALPEDIAIELHITQAHVVVSASIAACKQ